MKHLDPRAFWLFFLGALFGLLFLYLILGIFSGFWLSFLIWGEEGSTSAFVSTWLILNTLFLIIILAFSLIWAKLTYNNYKYELRTDGFRKEHGVIWKKYVTIPYERIQNVDIYRGILARLLGLSDLQIQTAGMSGRGVGSYGAGSEGRLPGVSVEEAEKLRDELVKRAKGHQGL